MAEIVNLRALKREDVPIAEKFQRCMTGYFMGRGAADLYFEIIEVTPSTFVVRMRNTRVIGVADFLKLSRNMAQAFSNFMVDMNADDRFDVGLNIHLEFRTTEAQRLPLDAPSEAGRKRSADGGEKKPPPTALSMIEPMQIEQDIMDIPADLLDKVDPDDRMAIEGIVTDVQNMESIMPLLSIFIRVKRKSYTLAIVNMHYVNYAFVKRLSSLYPLTRIIEMAIVTPEEFTFYMGKKAQIEEPTSCLFIQMERMSGKLFAEDGDIEDDE